MMDRSDVTEGEGQNQIWKDGRDLSRWVSGTSCVFERLKVETTSDVISVFAEEF